MFPVLHEPAGEAEADSGQFGGTLSPSVCYITVRQHKYDCEALCVVNVDMKNASSMQWID